MLLILREMMLSQNENKEKIKYIEKENMLINNIHKFMTKGIQI